MPSYGGSVQHRFIGEKLYNKASDETLHTIFFLGGGGGFIWNLTEKKPVECPNLEAIEDTLGPYIASPYNLDCAQSYNVVLYFSAR